MGRIHRNERVSISGWSVKGGLDWQDRSPTLRHRCEGAGVPSCVVIAVHIRSCSGGEVVDDHQRRCGAPVFVIGNSVFLAKRPGANSTASFAEAVALAIA
jgi:hypothetical protein